jgi:hypothetical protein
LHEQQQYDSEIKYFKETLTQDRGIVKWSTTEYWEPDDVQFISASTEGQRTYIIAELKERFGTYTSKYMEKYGSVMQVEKLKRLQEKAKQIEEKKNIKILVYYMMKCSDGVTLVYDVTNENPDETFDIPMPDQPKDEIRIINKKIFNLKNNIARWM